MSSIGQRIRSARIAKGVTQVELAERCGWAGGQRRTSHYESDRSKPSYEDMVLIGRQLGVNPAWLAFGQSNDSSGDSLESNADIKDHQSIPFYAKTGLEDLTLPIDIVALKGIPAEAAALLELTGGQMSSMIPAGSKVLLDMRDKSLVDGGYYAIDKGDVVWLRQVYQLGNGMVRLHAANQAVFADEDVQARDLKVVGRAVAYVADI